ncbi:Ig-like domain-containing protein [Pedobacter sp. P351]|uniref:Ig-like domain-containing protein n=1 Tax=Pedobacter superstes TaxID=3133441 RepID=UPI00309BBB49
MGIFYFNLLTFLSILKPTRQRAQSALFFGGKITIVLFVLLTGLQLKGKAQCNNAVTSGDFSSLAVGQYNSIGSFSPATQTDFIKIVSANGSTGAHIKRTLNYSLKQTLSNLTSDSTYTLSFNYSLLAGCNANAQTNFRVQAFNGTTSLGLVDFNATNGGGTLTGAISFRTPVGVTSVTIVFTDPSSNGPSCGAVIDNVFILSSFTTQITSQTNVSCFNQSNGSFTVSGTGGAGSYTGSYTVNGNTVPFTVTNGSATVNNLAAGSYTVTLTDANLCSQTKTITITQPSVLAVSASKTDISCFGLTNGSVALGITGGTAPYTYSWSNGASTQNISNLSTGSYSVTVTDSKGCSANASVNIAQPTAISLSEITTNPTCFDNSDGTINLTVSGGTSPYTYSWSNGSVSKNQTGLVAGNYTVVVTDSKGCTSTKTISLVPPAAIVLSNTITSVSCFGGNTGAIDLSVSGGTAPYSYTWSNGSTVQDLSNLTAGTYTVTVTDNKNCSSTSSIVVNQPLPITITPTSVNLSCAGNSDGSIALAPSGGTAPYTYLWNTGSTASSISGLTAGTYNVTVTDSKGCTAVKIIGITQPAAISLSASQTNLNCFGSSTGAINLTVSGGSAPFTYAWTNISSGYTSTNEDLSALPAGTYSVTVTDSKGCTTSTSVTLTQTPEIILTSATTDVTCFGSSTGAINLSVSGGAAPYTYSWTNASTSQDLTNLPAGAYTVTVTDSKGCTKNLTVNVSQPASAISVTGNVTNVSCFSGNTGSIDISVTGGTSPYTYNWSNGNFSQDINNLTAGTYTVTVTDAKGCVQTLTLSVSQPTQIQSTFTSVNPTCVGGTNGSITLTPTTGGVGPYTYSWTKNGSAISSSDLNALTAGTYQVTVTDQSGCSIIKNIVLNDPQPIVIDVRQIDIICAGADPTTSISIDISGGTTPYIKSYSPIDATSSLLTVTDFYGCVKTKVVPYSVEPPIIIESTHINVNCYGDNTGSINITVSGGNGPYTYLWSDNASLNVSTRNNLIAGTYTIKILDNTGCELNSLVVDITQPATPLSITQSALQNVTCNQGSDGSISVNVSGGTVNYSYSWSNGATTKDISNLSAGLYTLTVTDAHLCQKTLGFEITAPAPLVITPTAVNITCNNANDGQISLVTTGGTGTYTYAWADLPSGSNNLSNRTGLAAGTYNVTVTDAAGCTAFKSVTLTQPAALTLTSTQVDINCFGAQTGSVSIEISGGTAPYTYLGNTISANLDISSLPAGPFSAIITDSKGCQASLTITINQPAAAMNFAAATTNVSCSGETDGSISISGNGGTAPYTYLWSNSSTTSNLNTLPAGTYSVTITDANGCTFPITGIVISEPAQAVTILGTLTPVDCFGGNTGAVNLSVSGGTAPYRYVWSNGQVTEDVSNLTAGNYEVTVIDSKNCQSTQSFTINQPASPISASIVTEDVKCFGAQTGKITVTPSGGTGPYTVKWSTGEETNIRTSLGAAIYSGQIIDSKGCTYNFNSRIFAPPNLSLSISQTNNLCPGQNIGSADVMVTGGTAPYTYLWSNGQTSSEITNLLAGTYTVVVTDANNCVSSQGSVTITDPTPISVTLTQKTDINCFGDNSGTITISATGGSGSYFYEWSNGATSQNLSGLSAGTYSVKVIDMNACTTISTDITITQPSAPLLATATQQNVTCYNGTNGSITLTVSGGTSPYSYLWNDGATSANRSNLASGLYTATVTDARGCTYPISVQINQPSQLSVSYNKTDASCFGSSTGIIQLIVSGGTPAYSYIWKKNGVTISSPDLNALSAGTYEVTVTDANTCTPVTQTITIGEPSAALTISAVKTKDVGCNGGNDGTITVTANGGTPGYTYSWTKDGNAIASPDLNMLTAGVYVVTVTDNNGCTEVSNSITVSEPAVLIASASAADIACTGGTTTVTASATGGTAAYTYSIDGGSYQASANFSGITAGEHTVKVSDLNGCTATYRLVIQEPEALQFTITTNPILCSGSSSSNSIVVNVSGGTAPYTVTNVLLSGTTYRVTVTDQSGCTSSQDIVIIEPNPMLVEVSKENISCFGLTDGKINIEVSGGTGPYTYSLDAVNFSNSSGVFGNLAVGNYTVTVKDANGCTVEIPVTLSSPVSTLSAALTQGTAITCNGGTTTATVTASGGTMESGYSYLWNTLPAQTAATATGLKAGTYSVTVADANGCTQTESITITQPDLISLTSAAVSIPIKCFGEKATVTLAAAGGIAPLSYTFNGETNTSGIFNNVAAGTGLSYSITDANGCTPVTGTIDVTEPALLLALVTDVTDATCFGTQTGAVTIEGRNGTAPYTFSKDGINFQNNGTFLNLPAGTYNIHVKDANNCTINQEIIIEQPAALTLAVSSKTDALCNAASTGSVTAGTVTNAVGTINYSWTNASGTVVGTTATVNNLPAGTYTLSVNDNCSTQNNSVTIDEPAALALAPSSKTDALCNATSTGSVTAGAVTNALGTVNYSWKNAANTIVGTTASVSNLPAGTYTLTANDNCSALTNTVTIAEPAALALAASSKTDALCNAASTGSVTAGAVTNAVGTIIYSWKNAANTVVGTTATVSNLPAGTYTLTVTDDCSTLTNSVTIGEPAALSLAASGKTDASCNGTSTGSVTAGNVTNAVGTISYSWKNAANTVVGTTATLINLPAGTYTLTVTDNCSTLSNSVTIDEPAALALASSFKTDASCNATSTGSVTAGAVTNAVGVISYRWKNASGTVVGSTASVNGLPAGTYTLTVTDNCSSLNNTVTIGEPAALALATSSKTDALCNSASTGSVTAGAVTNSVGTIHYRWTNASGTVVGTSPAVGNLPAGTYTLTINDDCSTLSNSVTIGEPAALALAPSGKTDASCNATSTGIVSAGAVSNAVGAISYSWTNSSGTVVGSTATVTNLPAGTYTLTVNDNCSTLINTVSIAEPPALNLGASSKTDALCNAASTGSVTAGAVTNAVGTLIYSWKNASGTVVGTSSTVNNLPAGTYTLTVTDNCSSLSNTVTIAEPAALVLSSSIKTDALCHGASNGTITAGTVTNAVGPVSFSWKNAANAIVGTTASISNLPAGTYTLTVTDNCSTLTNTVTIAEPAALDLAVYSKTDVTCRGGNDGTITAGTVSNAIGTVIYSWKNASGTVVGTTATVSGLPAGVYTLTVNDNCSTLTNTVTIGEPAALALATSSKTDALCNAAATGSVTAGAVSNAVGTVNYNWQNESGAIVGTTSTVNNLPAGIYTLTVTDNCSSLSNTVTIGQPAALAMVAPSKTDALCNGASSGTVTAGTVSNAVGTVNYRWTNAAGTVVGTTATVSNLPAGTYTLTVNDNCSALINTVTIAQPAALVLAASSKTDASCNAASTGSVTAGTVTNAVGTINYSWKNAANTEVGTTATLSNLPAGTYTLTVTDNCFSRTNTVTIGEPAALVLAASSKTDANCNASSTGSVTAGAVTNAVGAISYSWKNAANTVVGTTASVSNLPAGTYTLTVSDNCSALTNTVTITEPTELAVTLTKTHDVTCNGGSDGAVSMITSGGTPGYNYAWTKNGNPISAPQQNALSAGIYIVTVTDANSCTQISSSVTISEPAALALSASAADILCHGGTTTINASATGGTPGYTYSLNGLVNPTPGSSIFAGAAAGEHILTVTDQNGCSATYRLVIQDPEALQLSITTATILCNGSATSSSIIIDITGGKAPYTADRTLISGTDYRVTVTDQNGCSLSQNVVIAEPNPIVSAVSKKNISCAELTDGEINVTVSGGTAPYTFSKDGTTFQAGGTFSGLAANNYTITVKDNNGCTVTIPVIITGPASPLNAAISQGAAITCYGGTTTATITASGGTPGSGYSYLWNTVPAQTTATATALKAGTYSVTVTDANSCSTLQSVTITEPDEIILTSATATSPIKCYGETATLTFTATGGIAPISYTFNGETNTSGIFNNVAAGTALPYSITDANGCIPLTGTINVSQPALLLATVTNKTDVNCFGTQTGSITVEGNAGTAPYSYSINNGPFQADGTFSTLAAGTYNFIVIDANNCTASINSVIIGEPSALTLGASSKTDALCNAVSTGSVTAGIVTNAVGTVIYSWKNASGTVVGTTATVSDLPAGVYTLTVNDNCSTLTNTVTIGEPAALALATSSKTDALCNAAATGSVTAGAVSNAVGTVNYNWQNESGAIVGTTSTVNNLPAGIYTLTVTDNCSSLSNTVTIGQPAALAMVAPSKTDALCNGASSGTVTAGTISNAVGTVNYRWTNAAGTVVGTTATVSNLPAGTYTLTVNDNCSALINTVTIAQPAALVLAASSKTDASCNAASTGSVTAGTVTNAVGTINYSWKNAANTEVGTTATLSNLPAGTYTLTVTDNCFSRTNTVTIGEPAALVLAASSKTDANCNASSTGSVTAGAVTNAVGAISYSWKNAANTVVGTTASVSNLPAGTYTLTVSDNCFSRTNNVTIAEPAVLTLAASSKTDASCNGSSTGSISAGAVTNALGTITYSWKNASGTVVGTTASVNNLPADTYTLTVTDNCSTLSNTVTIAEPAALMLTASSKTDALCNSASTGSVSAGTVTNAVGTINYSWKNASGTVVGTTASVNNLPAGTYTLTITDNCFTLTNTVLIGEPAALTLAPSSKTDALCNGTSTGTVSAGAVSNAVGTVTYSWKNEANLVVGTTPNVNNLPAGTYTLTVKDNCNTLINTVTISEPAALALTASSKTDALCHSASTGTVTAGTVTNAVGPVSYSWKNASGTLVGTTASVNNLSAGTYTLTVTDNCSGISNTVTIAEPAALALAASSKTDALCNASSTGTVTAGTVSNAVGTINYSWKNASGTVVGNTPALSNLPAGTYNLTVTDDCSTLSNSVTIGEPTALALAPSSKTDASCYGSSTGSVTAGTVTNALGSVSYSWKNASGTIVGTTASVNDLPAGIYTLTTTDNCSALTNSITVGEPAALAASLISQSPVLCFSDATGTVSIAAANGTAPYTYSKDGSTFQSSGTFTGLMKGGYTIIVKDAKGCTTTQQVNIDGPTAGLSATIAKTDVQCFGSATGTALISVSGGTAPYSYSWNTSPVQAGLNVTNLSAGTYTVTITDANGCKMNESITILQNSKLSGALQASKTICKNSADGSITASISGGVAPYTYKWNNTASLNQGALMNAAAGNYQVLVTDSKGCTLTLSGTILPGNCTPVAINDNFNGNKDVLLTNSVAANDTDPDGDVLTFSLVTQPQNGQINFNTNGGFTFTPNAGWVGSTTFDYRACDAQNLCATATASITISAINYPPVAVNDTYTTLKNTSLNASVSQNDSDPNGDNLNFSIVSLPPAGTLNFQADGTFTYIPAQGFIGQVTFAYKVCDPMGLCANATATINVAPVNEPPVANNDNFTLKENQILTDVLSKNDTDPNSDPLKYTTISQPLHGLISINQDGSFTYTPDKDYTGNDEFTYKACDPSGACDDARVSLVIQAVEKDLVIPNIFTPNGDGVNETFEIRGLNIYPENEISIINRWGNTIYEKKNYENTWEGNGLDEGTYFYILKVRNAGGTWKVYKGYVTLLRSTAK